MWGDGVTNLAIQYTDGASNLLLLPSPSSPLAPDLLRGLYCPTYILLLPYL